MIAAEVIKHYDKSMLAMEISFDVVEGRLQIDNTGTSEGCELFKFNPEDHYEVYLQRDVGFVLHHDFEKIYFSIINIGNTGLVRSTKLVYNYAPNVNWKAWLALCLVTDFTKGSPTFRPIYCNQFIYLMRKLTASTDNIVREFPDSNIMVSLRSGVFVIESLEGYELFKTNDFKELTLSVYNEAIARSLRLSA